ncbi:MAG: peptidylprolyl isomerase [Acetobacteraceae bacterium]
MRTAAVLGVLVPLAGAPQVWAQTAPQPSASPVAPTDLTKPMFDTGQRTYETGDRDRLKHANTVVAEVDGRPITLGDVGDAIRAMPSSIAAMPFQALFMSIVDQLVRREALSIRAHQLGLEKDPEIQRRMKAASDLVLGNEMLRREITATIAEQEILDRYQRDYAGKPGPELVHARIIMVPTEKQASDLIAELKAGADFATLARRDSKDTTAKNGGDLGFLRQSDFNPEIGGVAFSLPVGQFNVLPIKRAGSWFIVKVEARAPGKTPAYSAVRRQIVDAMVRERVPETVKRLTADVTVRKYDMNGNEAAELKPDLE